MRPPNASILISTGWPTRMSASCDSLKLAVTQMSRGTTIMIACPGAASAPTAAVSFVTRPSTVRFVLTDLRVGLIDRGFIVSCIDCREQIAFFHDLVVGNIDTENPARDCRANQLRPAIDKAIVCTLVVTGVKIPREACDDANHDQTKAYDHCDRVLLECAPDSLGTPLLGWIGFRRLAVGFSILRICLRFPGPDVAIFLQGRIGRICGPFLG